jgi:hypothetical protein
MGKYVLEISDWEGNSGQVQLSLPFYKKDAMLDNSHWRVLTEGFLKFRSGGCRMRSATGNEYMLTAKGDLELCVGKTRSIYLIEFCDGWGAANDSGEGYIQQWACGQCKPPKVNWALIS